VKHVFFFFNKVCIRVPGINIDVKHDSRKTIRIKHIKIPLLRLKLMEIRKQVDCASVKLPNEFLQKFDVISKKQQNKSINLNRGSHFRIS